MTDVRTETRRPGAEPPPARERRPARRLPWPLAFYQSAVGKKWVMALTGIGLMGYVLAHMIGNFKVYFGPEDLNHYGEALRDLGGDIVPRTHVLWLLRAGLFAFFVLHIHAAYALTRMNRQARPDRYASPRDYVTADFAARTMRWTGVIVLLYVLFHLADLTWGWANPDFVRGDVYHNLVESFSRWPVALLYIAANIAVAIHLYHGAWSIFQTMGVNSPRYNAARRVVATTFAVVIGVGNCLFPVMVLAGVIE